MIIQWSSWALPHHTMPFHSPVATTGEGTLEIGLDLRPCAAPPTPRVKLDEDTSTTPAPPPVSWETKEQSRTQFSISTGVSYTLRRFARCSSCTLAKFSASKQWQGRVKRKDCVKAKSMEGETWRVFDMFRCTSKWQQYLALHYLTCEINTRIGIRIRINRSRPLLRKRCKIVSFVFIVAFCIRATHTATQYNTRYNLSQDTAACCNTPQHVATESAALGPVSFAKDT